MSNKNLLPLTFSLVFLALLVIGFVMSRQQSGGTDMKALSAYFDPEWAANAFWDDGQAEVSLYEAEQVIYGKARKFEYTYIVVKEDFNKAFNVKTDDYNRDDLFPVMKLNLFARIPTDNYPYHFMSSLFFLREAPLRLHKFSQSSQEWCGQTFKEFNEKNGLYHFNYHSYWDGQGTGTVEFPATALFEDQLAYSLRSLRFEDGLSFTASLWPSQIGSKAQMPKASDAVFTVFADTLPQSEGQAWHVAVDLGENQSLEFWFDQAYPHVLQRFTAYDGRNWQLKSTSRYAYWERKAP